MEPGEQLGGGVDLAAVQKARAQDDQLGDLARNVRIGGHVEVSRRGFRNRLIDESHSPRRFASPPQDRGAQATVAKTTAAACG